MVVEQPGTALKRTALCDLHERMGVRRIETSGWEASDHFGAPEDEAERTRTSVGLADCGWLPKFQWKGNRLDRPPQTGGDGRAWKLGTGHYLVTCGLDEKGALEARLDSLSHAQTESDTPPFYTTDVTSVYASLLLAGPRSTEVLGKLTDLDISDSALPDLRSAQTAVEDVHTIVMREDIGVLPAYLLLTGREFGEWFWEAVMKAGKEFDITPFGLAAYPLLRGGRRNL